ncbi:PREDICTED: uncharacterized protein LOC109332545 [Lupinus angustifolius]|uniref:uncharacterized protein LOC109332545 n=1 Tax=Lupinus angustifolius TaxID=3871 RepID=UPI00092E9518|nr:PREDICTED: uncharacterized protein LOC109332545 [Lupinus angustifolius]
MKMPFGLCNAPATFQRCMLAIFSDLVEQCIEVFMDDFSIFESSFDSCLANLDIVLQRCVETNLILNWEKCHFMVTEVVVLGHKISSNGIEVDKEKIEVIKDLPPPLNVQGIQSFLGHAGFYRSDYVVGAILGLRKAKVFHAIHYASKEFDLVIKDKKRERPWFADMANFKAAGVIPEELSWHQKRRFSRESRQYVWDDLHLFKTGSDGLWRRCVSRGEAKSILWHCHSSPYGGHFNEERTTAKVLQSGFYCPSVFKDAHQYAQQYDKC